MLTCLGRPKGPAKHAVLGLGGDDGINGSAATFRHHSTRLLRSTERQRTGWWVRREARERRRTVHPSVRTCSSHGGGESGSSTPP